MQFRAVLLDGFNSPGKWLFVLAGVSNFPGPLSSLAADPFQELVRPTDALTAEQEEKSFHLPPGFSIQLFASEPMINKPINMGFDARGRLWVSSSVEYPFPAAKDRWVDAEGSHVRDSRDAIKILEDTDGDGRADKVTDFADGLNIPIGVLPYKNGCIAWSIPNIWFFQDTDGDDKCDKRTILFGPLGWEKDTHGNIASLRLGLDGWVYATHGFSNTSHFKVRPEHRKSDARNPKSETLTLNSGNVFRFKPDGSAVELWSRGQVNPFGLSWDSWGNLYSADCHSNPITQLIRGASYPSFGKPDDGLGFGPVMCPHAHGSTGICGPIYLDGGVWGPEWDDHMLVCNPVTSRINHDKITFTGSTPHANELPDFLTTDDPWFRPVDLQLGTDGALYAADFYNKIIGHYEVDLKHPGRDRERGRIWRIAKEGIARLTRHLDAHQEISRNTGLEAELVKLQDPNILKAALDVVFLDKAPGSARRRVAESIGLMELPAAVWPTISRFNSTNRDDLSLRHTLKIVLRSQLSHSEGFRALTERELTDVQLPLVVEVIRTINTAEASTWLLRHLRKNPGETQQLAKSLSSLARNLPSTEEPQLVAFAREKFGADLDTQLDLLTAIRQGLAQRGTAPSEPAKEWAVSVAEKLLVAAEGELPWTVAGERGTGAQPSPWGAEPRPCADGKEADFLSSLPPPRGAGIEKLTGSLLSKPFVCPPKLVFWLAGHRGFPNNPPHEKNFVALVDAASGVDLTHAYPPRNDTAQRIEWDLSAHVEKLVQLKLTDGDNGNAYAWLAAGRFDPAVVSLRLTNADSYLRSVAEIARELKLIDLAPRLAAVLSRVDLSDATRSAVAQTLTAFPGMEKVLGNLFKTAPSRLQSTLAITLAGSKEGAQVLCATAPARLLMLPAVAQKLQALSDAALDEQVKARTKDLPPPSAEAEALIASRVEGYAAAKTRGVVDASKGAHVYALHCAICHQIGGQGQVVGPQLDGIGNRGVERLCEDILDPNRALDPMFHLRILKMKDGSVVSGLQRREEGAVLVLADATGRETMVPKDQVAQNTESALSLMAPTFGISIPERDFYDLLAWLLDHSQK
ncbi:MAG: PVC-type heme-binding CxxCH protein [Verrucomicrobiales bacterium]